MDSSTERGLDRLNQTLATWGPVMAALVDARKAMVATTDHLFHDRRFAAIATLSRAIDDIDELLLEDDDGDDAA